MDESQPLANAELIELTLQSTLELSQIARFTWDAELFTQAVVPVLAKKTAKVPLSPGASERNALSNWYEESKPTAACAGLLFRLRTSPSASAAAVMEVEIRRMCPP